MKTRSVYAAKIRAVMRSAISAGHHIIYFVASTAEYMANLFGVSRSFMCLCVRDVSKAITSKSSHVVNFPNGDELFQIINDYEQRWGLPMRAGAIDDCHIYYGNTIDLFKSNT